METEKAHPTCTVLNFLAAHNEKEMSFKNRYLYKISESTPDEVYLEDFMDQNCPSLVDKAKQLGFENVEYRQHEILLRKNKKFNDIQDLRIDSLSFPEILKFEGISLWQFVTERCYDAYPREIIEIIEYVTELIEKFNPEKLRVLGKLKNPQRAVLELIAEHYKKEISFFNISAPVNTGNQEADNKLFSVEPDYKKLEERERFAVRDYISSVQKYFPQSQPSNRVLLLSFPRVWTKNCDGVEIDLYYEAFKAFFKEKQWEPIRVDVPYYFTIQGSKKEYIDSCKIGEKGGFPTIFFDEYYDDEIVQVGERYRRIFERNFNYFSKTREFRTAFTWKGISFFQPLYDFWRNLFVDYLAKQCVTAILTSRRILRLLKPKVIFAVYEVGAFARAMIIEAHRMGTPSIGLAHSVILPENPYYGNKNVSNNPNLGKGFYGFVVPTKTLVFWNHDKEVLTKTLYYPEDAVFVLGFDWKLLNRNCEALRKHKIEVLKKEWFSGSKKIALILTQLSTLEAVSWIVKKLDPSKYSILVKLHPFDKNEHLYYKTFTENNFEVKVIRDYLYESIEMADLIFAPRYSSVVLDCMALEKRFFVYKAFDVGYTLPWEDYVKDMSEIDDYDEKVSEEDSKRIHSFFRDVGCDRNITIESFNAKLHQVFDELAGGAYSQSIPQGQLYNTEKTASPNWDNNRVAESTKIANEAKKLLALGNSKGTAPALKKALEFTPDYIPPHNNAEVAMFQTKKIEQVAGSLKQTYPSDSGLVSAGKNLATVAKEADRIDKAENIYSDSPRQWPSDNEICAEIETKSVAGSVPCESETATTDIGTGTVTERELLRFQNDLYKQLDVNYDNYFPKIYENESPYFKNRPIMQQIKRISFELSNICNYAYCHKKCPLHGQKEKIVLPSRIVRETIDEVAQINYDGVFTFHIYSEPLIDPRLFSFMIYSKTKCPKSKTLILTNGFYLNQRIADELAELGIWILAVTAYSRSEFNRLSALDVKIPYYVFESKLDDRQNIYDSMPVNIKTSCFAPVGDVSVACTGDVVLCCLDWKRRHRFGNLTRESLYSILNKKETLEVYNSLIRGERKLYLCRRCNWAR